MVRDCAVCFKAPGAVQPTAWLDLCEELSKGPESPDSVLFIYLKEDSKEFLKGRDDANFINYLVRFKNRFPCYSLAYDLSTGTTYCDTVQSSANPADRKIFFTFLNSSFEQILLAGLQQIFSVGQIIVAAPPGFEFLRHSGNRLKRSRVFLRAEQGLTDTAVVSFVALEIWRRLMRDNNKNIPQLDSIYVDTMGISPVAFAIREFFVLAKTKLLPQVESFHSYGGMEKVRISDRAKTLCLISASTSMNMHRDWVDTHAVEPSQTIMLVTHKDADNARYALVQLEDSRLKEVITKDAPCEPYSIQISGETFVPNLEGAKSVLIGLKHSLLDRDSKHKIDSARQAAIYKSAALLVHGLAGDSNPTHKTILIDSTVLAADQTVRDDLINTIDKFGFAKSKWVIYADDSDSKTLAQYLGTHLGMSSRAVISAKKVASIPANKFSDLPAIVVGIVVGQGSQFLGISRDLRGRHTGDRLYWAGIHIPPNFAAKSALAKNLEKSKTGEGAYKFSAFCSLPCGTAGAMSFVSERILYQKFPNVVWPNSISTRIEQISKTRLGSRAFGFMPTGIALDQELKLREGFSFWLKKYEEGSWAASVLWAIGAVLQSARENSDLPIELQLRSTALNQVLLDPENFSRFNDGIVQAAILRMALNHELDYRVQRDMSDRMRRFITRMFRNLSDLNSEALLEFLVALATEKLRLQVNDLTKLITESRTLLKSQQQSDLKVAVSCFLDICAGLDGVQSAKKLVDDRVF